MGNKSRQSVYDEGFFSYTSRISDRSSEIAVPILSGLLPEISSVVDFGAAECVWISKWKKVGIEDIIGIDGNYVDQQKLWISPDKFHSADLNKPIDLKRRFDFAYSLEVAEHLKPEASAVFVESLVRHSDIVLFSAAPPGQGGESHINEKPMEFWRDLFVKNGYAAYDCIRPKLIKETDISYWYRYNALLYIKKGREELVSRHILDTRLEDDAKILDISPMWFKMRKAVVRMLPVSWQNVLARLKARKKFKAGLILTLKNKTVFILVQE